MEKKRAVKKTVGSRSKTKAQKAVSHKAQAPQKGPREFSIPVYNSKGKEVGQFSLNKELFDGIVNKGLLYQAVVMYSAKKRQGNASTKTRGDVSGGGKKPWRQKGTGRARSGSSRSPLWRHGGSVFGPHPRDYSYSIPKKMKRLALLSSINSKLADNKMIGIDSIDIAEPKTKNFAAIMGALKLAGKALFVVDKAQPNVVRASRNIANASLKDYRDFNTMDVLGCNTVVIQKAALEKLPERFRE